VILRDEKNARVKGKTKQREIKREKESKRERSRHPKQNQFFGSDLF
jgi:hypothetical protein